MSTLELVLHPLIDLLKLMCQNLRVIRYFSLNLGQLVLQQKVMSLQLGHITLILIILLFASPKIIDAAIVIDDIALIEFELTHLSVLSFDV